MEELQNSVLKNEGSLFTFETTYTKDIMEDYLRHGRYNAIKVGLTFFILSVMMVALGFAYVKLLIYFGAFLFFFVLLVTWTGFYTERNVRKNFPEILNTKFEYTVFEDEFHVESIGPNAKSSSQIPFSHVMDFQETDLLLIVRLKSNQVYLFNKLILKQMNKYELLKRILLNHSKSYQGLKINHKKDVACYEFTGRGQKKRGAKRSQAFVDLMVNLFFIAGFIAALAISMLLMDDVGKLIHQILCLVIQIISLVILVALKVRYKHVKNHTLYIILNAVLLVVTSFVFGLLLLL